MTVLESIKLATNFLQKYKIEKPRLNAELLLADILRCKRLELYIYFDKPLTDEEINNYREFIIRRSKNEPIQYITGKAYFYGMEFFVDKNVLIPRPETELLVEEILINTSNKIYKILDIGTGSGNIAIVLGSKLMNSIIHSIDVSQGALKVAEKNIAKHKITNVKLFNIDIFHDNIHESDYDIIVSNPPYLSEKNKDSIPMEVKNYEPEIALFVEHETKFYEKIVDLSNHILKIGGSLYFEIDPNISEQIYNLMEKNNFIDIVIKKDYSNMDRIIYGVKTK